MAPAPHLFLVTHLSSFAHINRAVINLDTLVPSYLAKPDAIWHLAKVLVDEVEEEPEVQVLYSLPSVKPSRKRRARKARSQIDVKFLRHSSRLSKNLQGCKDAESAPDLESGGAPDVDIADDADELEVQFMIETNQGVQLMICWFSMILFNIWT